ncbi:hypothetical protein [Mycoplasma wenyonii]|nr:hypothetical protein [Mycoplasma wenyonii]
MTVEATWNTLSESLLNPKNEKMPNKLPVATNPLLMVIGLLSNLVKTAKY